MIAKPIGKSMMVVEVFMIHMLSKPALNIKPPMIDLPPVPVYLRMFNAILLCKFDFCIAIDKKKPPKKR